MGATTFARGILPYLQFPYVALKVRLKHHFTFYNYFELNFEFLVKATLPISYNIVIKNTTFAISFLPIDLKRITRCNLGIVRVGHF